MRFNLLKLTAQLFFFCCVSFLFLFLMSTWRFNSSSNLRLTLDHYAINEFLQICERMKVPLFLIEPSKILQPLISSYPHVLDQLKKRHVVIPLDPVYYKYQQYQLISFGIKVEQAYRLNENFVGIVEKQGFVLAKKFICNSQKDSWCPKKQLTPSHIFFVQPSYKFVIQIAVFFQRQSNFLLNNDEVVSDSTLSLFPTFFWIAEIETTFQAGPYNFHSLIRFGKKKQLFDYFDLVYDLIEQKGIFFPEIKGTSSFLSRISMSRYLTSEKKDCSMVEWRDLGKVSKSVYKKALKAFKKTSFESGYKFWFVEDTLIEWYHQCDYFTETIYLTTDDVEFKQKVSKKSFAKFGLHLKDLKTIPLGVKYTLLHMKTSRIIFVELTVDEVKQDEKFELCSTDYFNEVYLVPCDSGSIVSTALKGNEEEF